MARSETDAHWNSRAAAETDDAKVNIADTVQRGLETKFVLSVLPPAERVLEVGCGNGYLTRDLRSQAGFVDAFDFSENMVERARSFAGERNNRFFHDNVLAPGAVRPPYDAVVCVRVLINLRDLPEQVRAVDNMAGLLKKGGTLILVEGFRDGFDGLNALRHSIGLPDIVPAAINFYSRFDKLKPALDRQFAFGRRFHSGMFDFLTRVVNPLLVGPENAGGPGEFHSKIAPLAQAFNPEAFASLSRLKGFELLKR